MFRQLLAQGLVAPDTAGHGRLVLAPAAAEVLRGGKFVHFRNQEPYMRALITKLASNDEGVTAIEYGMIAALIAVVIIAIVAGLCSQLSTVFSTVSTSL